MDSRNLFVSNRRFQTLRKALAAISGFFFLVSTNAAYADGAMGSVPTSTGTASAPINPAASIAPPVVPAAVTQGAAAIQAAGHAPGTTQMDLGSTAASVPLATNAVINVAGALQHLTAGTLVTPAQFLAAQQMLQQGRQSVAVGRPGSATGGHFNLHQAANGGLAGIVIPTGVTALGVNNVAPIVGDLVNYGTIYGITTNSANPTASIVANSITNQQGALITTIAPSAIQAMVAGALGSANLVLGAVGNITNKGTISSSADLTVASTTGSISNSGTMSAQGALNAITGNGVINNAGLIASSTSSINMGHANGGAVFVNGHGGTFSASSDINAAAVNANVTLSGGNYFSQNLNMSAGNGTVTGVVGQVSGTLNSSAGVAHFWADTPTLTLGNNCITGDPTFASTGNIVISGVNTFNEDVAILAQGNITAGNASAQIIAPGFNVSLIAGATVTINGGGAATTSVESGNAGSLDIGGGTGTNVPPWSVTVIPGATATADFSTPNGGNIDLTASTAAKVIDTSSPGPIGGNVTLSATANGAGTGWIKLNPATQIDTSSSMFGGQVRVYAGGDDGTGTGIQLGSIRTSGAFSGSVSIATRPSTGNAGATITYDVNGVAVGPSTSVVAPGPTTNSAATFTEINTSGNGGFGGNINGQPGTPGGAAGTVSINAGSVTGGNILAYGGGGGGGAAGTVITPNGGAGGTGGGGNDVSVTTVAPAGPSAISTLGDINTSGGGGGGGGGGYADTLNPGGSGGAGGTGGNSGNVIVNSSHDVVLGTIKAADGGSGGNGEAGTGAIPAPVAGAGGGGGGSMGGGGGGGAGAETSLGAFSAGGGGGGGRFGGGGGSGNGTEAGQQHGGGQGGGATAGGAGGTGNIAGNPGLANNGGNAAGPVPGGTFGIGGSGGSGGAQPGGNVPGLTGPAPFINGVINVASDGDLNIGTPGGLTFGGLVSLSTLANNGQLTYDGTLHATDSASLTTDAGGSGSIVTFAGSLIRTPILFLETDSGDIGSGVVPVVTDTPLMNAIAQDGGSVFINNVNPVAVVLFGNNRAGFLAGDTFSLTATGTIDVDGAATLRADIVGLSSAGLINDGLFVRASEMTINNNNVLIPLSISGSGTFVVDRALNLTSRTGIDLASNGIDLFNDSTFRWNFGIFVPINLTVIANNNITATGDGVARTLGDVGGNLNLMAGTDYNYNFGAPQQIGITGNNAFGGSVLFNGDTPISIDTSTAALGQDAGDVLIIAGKGSNANTGRVLFTTDPSINTAANPTEAVASSNGLVRIFAGSTNSIAIQLGDVITAMDRDTAGGITNASGSFTAISAQPNIALGTTIANGSVTAGSINAGTTTANGGISTGDINTFGGNVTMAGGGGITTGDINTSGAGGTAGAGGSAGDVFLDTTAGVNSIQTGFIRAYGGGGAGNLTGAGFAGGAGGDVALLSLGNINVFGDINSSGGGGGGAGVPAVSGGAGGAGGQHTINATGNVTILGPMLASGGAGGGSFSGGFGGAGGGSFGGGGGGANGGAGGGGFLGGGGSALGGFGTGGGAFGPGVAVGGVGATDGQNGAGGNGAAGFDGGLFGISGEQAGSLFPNTPQVGEAGAGGSGGLGGGSNGILLNANNFTIQNTIFDSGSAGIPGYNFASIGNSGFGDLGIGAFGDIIGGAAIQLTTTGLLTLGFGIGGSALPLQLISNALLILGLGSIELGTVNITTNSLTNQGSIISLLGDVNINGLDNQGSINPPAVPNLNNSGLIRSLLGDVNITSDPNQNLVVTGGGTIQADDDVTLSMLGTNNYMIFSGDQTFIGNTLLNAGGVGQTLWIQSGADVTGQNALTLQTSNLILDGNATGNPLNISSTTGLNISNTTGDLLLPNNVVISGQNLTLASVGSIIGTGAATIDLSNPGGAGGTLNMIAGFNLSTSGATLIIGTPNAGGSIILPNVLLNTSGSGGAAGGVTAAARNGNIELGDIIATGTAGGLVNLLGNGIKLSQITTTGGTPGDINVFSGTTQEFGNITSTNGTLAGGFFGVPGSQRGGNIEFTGPVSGGNITAITGNTGSITSAFALTAGGAGALVLESGTGGIGTVNQNLMFNATDVLVTTTGSAYFNTLDTAFSMAGVANRLELVTLLPNTVVTLNGLQVNDLLVDTSNSGATAQIVVANDINGVNNLTTVPSNSVRFVTNNLQVNGGSDILANLIEVQAGNNADLNINNAGHLRADLGLISILGFAGNNLNINISGGGTMRSAGGNVQITTQLNNSPINFTGNQTFIGNTNINSNSATGSITFANGVTVQGLDALNLNTPNLVFGNNVSLSGNPLRFNSGLNLGTIANPNGDVNIPSGLIYHGFSLAILASGNVNSAPGVVIDLSGTNPLLNSGSGGSLHIFAGYNFTPQTGGQVGPDGTVYTLGTPSVSGGSVNMAGTDITLASGVGDAGNLVVLAHDGLVNNGSISLGNIDTRSTFFGGSAGSVTLYGNGGISVGNIQTTGNLNGEVRIVAGTPTVTGTVQIWNGVVNPNFLSSNPTINGTVATNTQPTYSATPGANSGNISIGSINAGTQTVTIVTNGSGSITAAAGSSIIADTLLAVAGSGGIGTLANPLATNVPNVTLSSFDYFGAGGHGNVFSTNATATVSLADRATPGFLNFAPTATFNNRGAIYDLTMTSPTGGILINNTLTGTTSITLRGGTAPISGVVGHFISTPSLTLLTQGGNITVLTDASVLRADATTLGTVSVTDIGPVTLVGQNRGNNFNLTSGGSITIAAGATVNGTNAVTFSSTGPVTQVDNAVTITTPTLDITSGGGNIGSAGQALRINVSNLHTDANFTGDTWINQNGANLAITGVNESRDYTLTAPGTAIVCNPCTILARDLTIDTGATGSVSVSGISLLEGAEDVSITTGSFSLNTDNVSFVNAIIGNVSITTSGSITSVGDITALLNVTLDAGTTINLNLGSLTDSGLDMTLTANQALLAGSVNVGEDLSITTGGAGNSITFANGSNTTVLGTSTITGTTIDVSGIFNTTGDVTVDAGTTGSVTVAATGVITAGTLLPFVESDLTIDTGTFTNSFITAATGTVTINADGAVQNVGAASEIGSTNGDVFINTTGDNITNDGLIAAVLGDVTINSGTSGAFHNTATGTVQAGDGLGGSVNSDLNVSVGSYLNDNIVVADNNVTITASGAVTNNASTRAINGSVEVNAGGAFQNNGNASIFTAGTNMDIDAASILNNGLLAGNGGFLTLTTPNTGFIENSGTNARLVAANNAAGVFTATTGSFRNLSTVAPQISIDVGGNATITADTLIENQGTVVIGGTSTFDVQDGTFTNGGGAGNANITSNGNVTIFADIVNQNENLTSTTGFIDISKSTALLTVTPSTEVNFGAGSATTAQTGINIAAVDLDAVDSTITVNAGNLVIDGGVLFGFPVRSNDVSITGTSNIDVAGNIGIFTATLTLGGTMDATGAGNDILLDASSTVNNDAVVTAADALTLFGGTTTNTGTLNALAGKVDIDVDSLDNSGSIIATLGEIEIKADTTVTNSGAITSELGTVINAGTSFTNTATGTIDVGNIVTPVYSDLLVLTDAMTNAGSIDTTGGITVRKQSGLGAILPLSTFLNSGTINAGASAIPAAVAINIHTLDFENTVTGAITATDSITIDAGGVVGITNNAATEITNAGSLTANEGDITLRGVTIDNSGSISAGRDAFIQGAFDGTNDLRSTTFTNSGNITGGASATLTGSTIVLADSLTNAATGNISADFDVVLIGEDITNEGIVSATALALIAADDALVNGDTAQLLGGNIRVNAQSLANDGLIDSAGFLFITDLDNGITGDATGGAAIRAGSSLTITTDGDNNIHVLNAQLNAAGGGVSGANVLLLSGGNIFNTTSSTNIFTGSVIAGVDGGDITLVAGVGSNFNVTGLNSVEVVPGTNPGGFINFRDGADTNVLTLDTSSNGGVGGDVTMVAFTGTTSGTGWVGVVPTGPGQPSPNLISTGDVLDPLDFDNVLFQATGSGKVTIIAEGTNPAPIEFQNLIPITGSAITIGDVRTQSTGANATAAPITIAAASADYSGGSGELDFSNGALVSNNLLVGNLTSSSIVAGFLNTNTGDGTLVDNDNSTINVLTNGNLNFADGVTHNWNLVATNGTLTLPNFDLTASEDVFGNGGSINIEGGGIIYLGGNVDPLTLNAIGSTGNAGSVRVIRNSTSLLVLGTSPSALLINATGALNAGNVEVRNGGQLFVVMTAVPGPQGSGVGLNFAGGNGNGANIILEAGTMVPGILTLNGSLNVSATGPSGGVGTVGLGGSVELISNSPTVFNYGNTTASNTNGVQGGIRVNGFGTGAGSEPGNVILVNRGGSLTYAPTGSNVFGVAGNAVSDVVLVGASTGIGVTVSVTSPITAQQDIIIDSTVIGGTGNSVINITKNLIAGDFIGIFSEAFNTAGSSTINVTGALNGTDVFVLGEGGKNSSISLAAVTANGGVIEEGDVFIGNVANNGTASVKLNGTINATGTNADVNIDQFGKTGATITTKAITADDAIIIRNESLGNSSITTGGNFSSGSTIVMRNELSNTSGKPTGKITVGGVTTATNNVILRSIGNGNGSITINKNVTATTGDIDLESSGTGTITTSGTALLTAGDFFEIDAGTGTVGSGMGLNINALNLNFNALGAVLLNNKIATTAEARIQNSSAGKNFIYNTPGDVRIEGDITAPLGFTIKSSGTGNDIILDGGSLLSNPNTVGTTKGGIVSLTTTGTGSILNPGDNTIVGEVLNFTTGTNGNVGTFLSPLNIDGETLNITAPGTGEVAIENDRTSLLTVAKAVHSGGLFTLQSEGSILYKAATAMSGGTFILTALNAGSTITIDGAVGTSTGAGSYIVEADGNITGKGKLVAQNVLLNSVSGNVGGTTTTTPFNVTTTLAELNAAGSVNVKNAFVNNATLVDGASAGTNFTFTTAGGLFLNDVTTANGTITIVSAKNILKVNPNTTILANNGGITLQSTAGTIEIGNNTTSTGPFFDNQIEILTVGTTGKSINIVIGPVPTAPIAGPLPANSIVDPVGSGKIFFGKNGISVTGQTNPPTVPAIASFSAINTNLVFNTGSKPNTAIRVNQGVRIVADPPTPEIFPAISASPIMTQAAQAAPVIDLTTVNNSAPTSAPAATISMSNFAPINLSAATLAQIAAQSMQPRTADDFITDTELMTGEIPAVLSSDEGITVQTRVAGNATLSGGVTKNVGGAVAKSVDLSQGSVVFAPTTDTVVHTGYGDVHIGARSVVLVLSFNGGVGVYNLHDTKRGAVTIKSGSRTIDAIPGTSVVLTTATNASFDQINPAQLFLYRNVTEHNVAPAMKAFIGEFSPLSAMNAVLPLKQLANSKQPQARKLGESLLKTAAIVYQVRAAGGQYQQILRPSVAAWSH